MQKLKVKSNDNTDTNRINDFVNIFRFFLSFRGLSLTCHRLIDLLSCIIIHLHLSPREGSVKTFHISYRTHMYFSLLFTLDFVQSRYRTELSLKLHDMIFGARSLAYLTSRSHSHLIFFFCCKHSISYSRIFKLEFYFMKNRSCRESNSRLFD